MNFPLITSTDIANRALDHLGEPQIRDLDTDESHLGKRLKRNLPRATAYVLKQRPWSQAEESADMAVLSGVNDHRFPSVIEWPPGAVRINGVKPVETTEWEPRAGRRIAVQLASGPVTVIYNRMLEAPGMDDAFMEVVAARLAMMTTNPQSMNDARLARLTKVYDAAYAAAAGSDASEQGISEPKRPSYLLTMMQDGW